MVKVETREDAVNLIREIWRKMGEWDIRLGLAGSFSRNTQRPCSDIDIVIDYETSDDDIVILSKQLRSFVETMTDRDYDIIWLNQLKRQEEQQKLMLISAETAVSQYSPCG